MKKCVRCKCLFPITNTVCIYCGNTLILGSDVSVATVNKKITELKVSDCDAEIFSMLPHENRRVRVFTEKAVQDLKSEVHKITGDGEVMALFNKLLGINAG